MKNIVVSFSGGETSAYMLLRIWEQYSKTDNVLAVFANTGQEHEETLIFTERFSKQFNIPVVWVEGVWADGIGTRHKVVNFTSASRKGEPFEQYIAKHGMPNIMNPNCTRELKEYPIKSYIKSAEIKNYKLAIGIRADEMDRLGKHWYPLAEWNITKPHVNFFWARQPFRLNLKTYEGNCVWCWKKSLRKHLTLLNERPEFYEFPQEMEAKYENYDPRNSGAIPMRFFRNYLSIKDLVEMAKNFKNFAKDESKNYNYQRTIWDDYNLDVSNGCTESCEPFK